MAKTATKPAKVRKNRNIPPELFEPAPEAIHDPGLRALYDKVVEGLMEDAKETPGFGMIEAMLIERMAFLYIMIRDKERYNIGEERQGNLVGFAHERNHKEILATWLGMTQGMQSARWKSADPEVVKQEVLDEVVERLSRVVDRLPADIRPFVGEELRAEFSK